jgi:hypothetical protein
MGGSNLSRIKRLGLRQRGFVMMTMVVVCWEMFVIMWRESFKFQRCGQFSPILDSFIWRWHPRRRLGLHVCALVEDRGGNPNANDIPIPKHDNKLYFVLHLERIMIASGCLGNTWGPLLRKCTRFQILDMGESTQLSPMVEWWLWHMKWQLGWYLITLILILSLC